MRSVVTSAQAMWKIYGWTYGGKEASNARLCARCGSTSHTLPVHLLLLFTQNALSNRVARGRTYAISHRIALLILAWWSYGHALQLHRCAVLYSLSLFCAIFQIAPCVAVCALIESKYPKPLYGYGRPKMLQHTMGASFAIRRVLYGNGEKEKRSTHNLFGSCSAASRDIDIKWGFGRNSDEPAKQIEKKIKKNPIRWHTLLSTLYKM